MLFVESPAQLDSLGIHWPSRRLPVHRRFARVIDVDVTFVGVTFYLSALGCCLATCLHARVGNIVTDGVGMCNVGGIHGRRIPRCFHGLAPIRADHGLPRSDRLHLAGIVAPLAASDWRASILTGAVWLLASALQSTIVVAYDEVDLAFLTDVWDRGDLGLLIPHIRTRHSFLSCLVVLLHVCGVLGWVCVVVGFYDLVNLS